jgi:hypothetical protein
MNAQKVGAFLYLIIAYYFGFDILGSHKRLLAVGIEKT